MVQGFEEPVPVGAAVEIDDDSPTGEGGEGTHNLVDVPIFIGPFLVSVLARKGGVQHLDGL